MPPRATESLDYHRAFRELAKNSLPAPQYRALHEQARATAGGYASGHARRVAQQASLGRSLRRQASAVDDVLKAALAPPEAQDRDIEATLEAALAEPVHKAQSVELQAPIVGTAEKQILYCVCLEPETVDSQGDVMDAEAIEETAHEFVRKFMLGEAEGEPIHAMHERPIGAYPVESYIAPQDLQFRNGTFGDQVVKRGSWVVGIRVTDPEQWAKVKSGEYTGVSVGGWGLRIPLESNDAD